WIFTSGYFSVNARPTAAAFSASVWPVYQVSVPSLRAPSSTSAMPARALPLAHTRRASSTAKRRVIALFPDLDRDGARRAERRHGAGMAAGAAGDRDQDVGLAAGDVHAAVAVGADYALGQ